MKKLFAALLAVLMVVSMATVVSAETTTLTTTVPDAEYVLNVPKDQEITFGATSTDIGYVSVTGASGFAVGKNLKVTLTYDAFKSEGVSTTIPFTITRYGTTADGDSHTQPVELASGSAITFKGKPNGSTDEYIVSQVDSYTYTNKNYSVNILSEDWGKALGGDYTAVITFTAEVVVE